MPPGGLSCLIPLGRPRSSTDALFSDIASVLHCLLSRLSSAKQCIVVSWRCLIHPWSPSIQQQVGGQ